MPKTEPRPQTEISEAAQRISDIFKKQYKLNPSQLVILKEAMHAWDLCEIARQEIRDFGLTIPGDKGVSKGNPACSTLSQQQNSFRQALNQLGIDFSVMPDGGEDFEGDLD